MVRKDYLWGNVMIDRALLFVVAGACTVAALFLLNPIIEEIPPLVLFAETEKADPAINPGRAAGEIIEKALNELAPKNATYGLRGTREEDVFTLWGYWKHKGCMRKRIVAQVDIQTITASNYKSVAEVVVASGKKFLSIQERKWSESEQIAFEELPETQKRIANDLWIIGNHIGEHVTNAGMTLFIVLSSHRSEPIVSWCLATREHKDAEEHVATFVLPRLEMQAGEVRYNTINKQILRAYKKIQDAIRRSAPKQSV